MYNKWITSEKILTENSNSSPLIKRACMNYYQNLHTGLAPENFLTYHHQQLIIYQSGGNFPALKFGEVSMDDTGCEIIAVCNALRLLHEKSPADSSDFFKLAAEFEVSGMYKNIFKKTIVETGKFLGIKQLSQVSTADGAWGSNPLLIANCLTAHKISFRTANSSKQFSQELKKAVCGIVSYRFDTLYQAIHTFACISDNNKIQAFNRFSNHNLKNCYNSPSKSEKDHEIYTDIADALSQSQSDSRFFTGFLLYRN